jgi:hypothetical protein
MTPTPPHAPEEKGNEASHRFDNRAIRWVSRHASLVGALVAGGLALALYVRTINYGFFGDDPTGNFRWMEGVSWLGLFTSSPGSFLRPLMFVISKLLWSVGGGYNAMLFHLIPWLLHAANTVLIGVLGSALSGRRSFGWLAALLFATFPLTHEIVSEFDTLCHSLLVFWVLLSLLFFERGRRTGSRAYLWAVYPTMVLALLSHENGLILPVLLLALELIYYPPGSLRELARRPVLHYFVIAVLYVLWWLSVPKAATSAPHGLDGMLRNTLPFLQVVAYPLLPLINLDVTQWGWLLALVAASLLVTFVAARALGTVRVWLFALALMVLASLPSVLFLDWDYLHGGPRLYYLSSVGAALLWASLPLAIVALARGSAVRRALTYGAGAALTLALVLPPIPFIRCQLDLFDQAAILLRQLSAQASTAPADRDLVFVNLPAFFISSDKHPAGCPATYPFVTTGVGVFPPYAVLQDFIRVNGGPDRPARGIAVVEYDAAWPPRYGEVLPLAAMPDTLRDSQVYIFETASWSMRDLSAIWQPHALPAQALQATFGDALALEEATVQQNPGELAVSVQWQVLTPPPGPITAFVHVYDRDGRLLAQHDGPLGQNKAPVTYVPQALWQPGDRIRDLHAIPLGDPLPNDGYTVAVGLYDSNTVQRLLARTPDGATLPNDLYMLEP